MTGSWWHLPTFLQFRKCWPDTHRDWGTSPEFVLVLPDQWVVPNQERLSHRQLPTYWYMPNCIYENHWFLNQQSRTYFLTVPASDLLFALNRHSGWSELSHPLCNARCRRCGHTCPICPKAGIKYLFGGTKLAIQRLFPHGYRMDFQQKSSPSSL